MTRDSHLFVLEQPYETLQPIDTSWKPQQGVRGSAIIWHVTEEAIQSGEFDWIMNRPRGLSCALVLPPPMRIPSIASFLFRLSEVSPNVVLPAGRLANPRGLRTALRGGPRNLSRAVIDYLWRHRVITSTPTRNEILRIFQLAPRATTISQLCREMYLSRRTLGRHFETGSLPVPSHWLQFARLLHVIMRSQSENTALFRIAISAGYPDGFTFSNQVKRLTGVRPTEARALIGFEWLVEAWLAREAQPDQPPYREDSTVE